MCSCVLDLAKSKKNCGFSCGTCEDLFDSTHNRFFKNSDFICPAAGY